MTSSDSKEKAPLVILDAPHLQAVGEDDGEGVTTIEVDGTPVKLDKLGPMIINTDGVSIPAWAAVVQGEQLRAV